MNNLLIDTSNNTNTKVILDVDGKKYTREEKRNKPGDQNVLELVEVMLAEHKLGLHDINALNVVLGPGSFTGLRVGVAIANVLSFAAKVSINGKPIGKIEVPTY